MNPQDALSQSLEEILLQGKVTSKLEVKLFDVDEAISRQTHLQGQMRIVKKHNIFSCCYYSYLDLADTRKHYIEVTLVVKVGNIL